MGIGDNEAEEFKIIQALNLDNSETSVIKNKISLLNTCVSSNDHELCFENTRFKVKIPKCKIFMFSIHSMNL